MVVQRQLDDLHVRRHARRAARHVGECRGRAARDIDRLWGRNVGRSETIIVIFQADRPSGGESALNSDANHSTPRTRIRARRSAGVHRIRERLEVGGVGIYRYVAIGPSGAAFAIDQCMAQRVDEKADTTCHRRERARVHLAIRSDQCREGLHTCKAAVAVEITGVSHDANDPSRRQLPVVAKLKAGEESGRGDLVAKDRRSVWIGECRGAGCRTDAAADVKTRPRPGGRCGRERQIGRSRQCRRHQG